MWRSLTNDDTNKYLFNRFVELCLEFRK
jgi:hypothetical protein